MTANQEEDFFISNNPRMMLRLVFSLHVAPICRACRLHNCVGAVFSVLKKNALKAKALSLTDINHTIFEQSGQQKGAKTGLSTLSFDF